MCVIHNSKQVTEGKKDAAQELCPTQLLPRVGTVPRFIGKRGCLVLCGPATERTGDGSAESQDDTATLQLVCSYCLVHEMSAHQPKIYLRVLVWV